MKALVLNTLGRGFDFEDVDIAAPMGREVLVNVQASGLCHTDLLFATHDIVPTPAVLGHEVAGIVAEVGPDVAQLRVGDHVVGSLARSCGACARWGGFKYSGFGREYGQYGIGAFLETRTILES
jgi:S-(hydroxymethyl)glutathione dehydrogenase / alcohol dehydrogenase